VSKQEAWKCQHGVGERGWCDECYYGDTLMGQQERLNAAVRQLGRALWVPLERALWRLMRRV
jgi:hypothetical protein